MAEAKAGRFANCQREQAVVPKSVTLLHLNRCCVARDHLRWLVHGLRDGRAHLKLSRIPNLQQIDVFVIARKICLEKGRAVIMEFAQCPPIFPPRGLLAEFIERDERYEFRHSPAWWE